MRRERSYPGVLPKGIPDRKRDAPEIHFICLQHSRFMKGNQSRVKVSLFPSERPSCFGGRSTLVDKTYGYLLKMKSGCHAVLYGIDRPTMFPNSQKTVRAFVPSRHRNITRYHSIQPGQRPEPTERSRSMHRNKKRSPLRISCLLIGFSLIVYLLAGLLPCMILPSWPDGNRQELPTSSSDVDEVMPVESGGQSLDIRLALISSAEEHIRLGTYIFGADKSGTEVMAALYRAADRGVKVEIMTDGILGVFNFHDDPMVYALGSHPNVTIYLYNPVDLFKPWNLNGRYHEKYMVADRRYSIIGGRNVSDEFLIEDTAGYSMDLEVLIRKKGTGISACDLLAERFDDMAASPFCRTAYDTAGNDHRSIASREMLRSYPVRKGADLSSFSLLPVREAVLLGSSFDPGNKSPDVMAALAGIAGNAEKKLVWCSPYFCPDAPMKNVLRKCAETAQCMLITNSAATGNNIIASADGVFQRPFLNGLPCEVWEVQSVYSLHTKALIIDDRISVIGSFNMDMRSAYLDTELMILLDSSELTERTYAYMTDLRDISVPVSDKAKAAGSGCEKVRIPFLKAVRILLISPLAALLRFLI